MSCSNGGGQRTPLHIGQISEDSRSLLRVVGALLRQDDPSGVEEMLVRIMRKHGKTPTPDDIKELKARIIEFSLQMDN